MDLTFSTRNSRIFAQEESQLLLFGVIRLGPGVLILRTMALALYVGPRMNSSLPSSEPP